MWQSQWRYLRILTFLLVLGTQFTGCTSPLFRAQSPDAHTEFVASSTPATPFVGDLTTPIDVQPLRVQSVALVTRLNGTGSDPKPSQRRSSLIAEMQSHMIPNISSILASDTTSLVLVQGYIPAGAQKGSSFDVEVFLEPRSETTSLAGGTLMQSRMREYRLLNNSHHPGHVIANAGGPILVDALFDSSAGDQGKLRGRVLGGGATLQTRPLGLLIHSDHTSVKTSSLIGSAINARFFTDQRGSKTGVAKPKDDKYIELMLTRPYLTNMDRYLRVVNSIPVGESASDQARRMDRLERQLLEPTSSYSAALQLEAIGKPSIPILKKGIESNDPEVRFYSAEALAYLDDEAGAKPLADAAREERAFRWRALTALSVMADVAAYDGLLSLLEVTSAETRYGAFRALRTRNVDDPLVAGEVLANEFGLHEIHAGKDSMVHFSRSRRQEIIIFGGSPELAPPNFLYAGPKIMLKAIDKDHIKVVKFEAGKDDVAETCSPRLADVIRTISKVGGGYSEVLACILSAKERGFLTCRVEIDATPRPGRQFIRSEDGDSDSSETSRFTITNPVPDLFFDRLNTPTKSEEEEEAEMQDFEREEAPQRKGIFARMSSWFKR